ncbi:hypothetical protein SAMN05421863_11941 [Nitrosomonas communis]|uniref:Uncharacterized protein n=1 Tax=Nitrosomonas communis TaxID=44574 RepID=A0A1I4Y075_9PROT|nr:hypothetical protein SAMN05421863_11941 [Nitrosomonas communis]
MGSGCGNGSTLYRVIIYRAKKYLINRIRKGNSVELRNVKSDKYFRLRADVFVDGINVGRR